MGQDTHYQVAKKPQPSLTRKPKRHLHGIQALRGVAVILVLLFHVVEIQRQIAGKINSPDLPVLTGLWDHSFSGVDLFFVISGFIMVYVTHGKTYKIGKIKNFLVSRFTRIYPLWWFYAALMALYFFMAYNVPGDPDRIAATGGSTPYILKSFLLIPQSADPVLGVGWTLIHEIYFYIIFAFILFLPDRRRWIALIIWALVTVWGYSQGYAATYANSLTSLMSSLLTLEFISGALMATLVLKSGGQFGRIILIAGLSSSILALIFYHFELSQTLLWARVLVFTIPFSLVVYGVASQELYTKIWMPPGLKKVGDWSYSIYLSHVLILSAMKRIAEALVPHLPPSLSQFIDFGTAGLQDNITYMVAGLCLCIMGGWFSYRYIEIPLIKISRRLTT